MSARTRMYLYEVDDNAWVVALTCAPENAQLPCDLARWAGLPADPAQTRWLPLPGPADDRVYYVGPRILVSTVPLPWLPESTRRGIASLAGGDK